MKVTQLKEFIEDLMVTHGSQVESDGPHLLKIRPDETMVERLGTDELVLAFNHRGLQNNPTSELATIGNPVFDQLLEIALESGQVGIRYAPEPAKSKKSPDLKKRIELGPGHAGIGDPTPIYTPLYCHTFKIKSSVDEAPDELETVCIDGVTEHSISQTPDLMELWESLDREPSPNRAPANPLPVPDSIVRAALDTVERRLRKRLGKLRRMADENLAKEHESIRNYYKGLITETKNAPIRSTKKTAPSKDEKIELLQLDWRRRMEEAQRFWTPRVQVRLASVAIVQQPRLGYSLLTKAGRQRRGHQVYFDPSTNEFLIQRGTEGVSLLDL